MIKPRLGMTARSGDKCQKTGVWKVLGIEETVTVKVSQGNKMPQHGTKGVNWKLIITFK